MAAPIDHAWALLKQERRAPRRRLGPEPGSSEAIARNMTARSRAHAANRARTEEIARNMTARSRARSAAEDNDEGLYRLGPQEGTEEYEARKVENANRVPLTPAPPREGNWGNELMQPTSDSDVVQE